ncbi:MAG: DNA polymerase III subunit alpha [Chloroflexota bacterium]|nr:DNA polymerase III subunit alpha [Chloroflexota bacterium]
MMGYVELHCHSNYSFQEGASFPHELLVRAKELEYTSLALTDHDNLVASIDFSKTANDMGIHPIIGAEITLEGGYHLTLLAKDNMGYSNLSRIISYAHINNGRISPSVDAELLKKYSGGLIALTGCSRGHIPELLTRGYFDHAQKVLIDYLDTFGSDNLYIEMQQNFIHGDTARNNLLFDIAHQNKVPTVATNNVHYHVQSRHKLNDTLISIKNNLTLDNSHELHRSNDQFYLKSKEEMETLFSSSPESLENTLKIADRCNFNLESDLLYEFPEYITPDGSSVDQYLKKICERSAIQKYGFISEKVKNRLNEELRRIRKHKLSGFFLIYYDIIQMAREVVIELNRGSPLASIIKNSPGRGRGSSVAMLVGYLIGLSHIDPLNYDLGLDRFLPEDLNTVPDIDLDFPRDIREELIKRIHLRYGWEYAALTGAISTYKIKSSFNDVGKTLNIDSHDIKKFVNTLSDRDPLKGIELVADKQYTRKPWVDLLELSVDLIGFPKFLQQHTGGMVISSKPIIDIVPVVPGAIKDRYIMQWDKDSIEQARMIKIDFLALGTLSQMNDILEAISSNKKELIDISRINFNDKAVYELIRKADTVGVFQIESAAQMQTSPRLKPVNLEDMAYQVAAVRPGVGVGNGVANFIRRRNGQVWKFDHILEEKPLARTLGVILYQDQVNELGIAIAGFSPKEADQMRRDFAKKSNLQLNKHWKERFIRGAIKNNIPKQTANLIFNKLNGEYMFPEAHAYAFGITAYQMAWLKFYYPLEFYVSLINQQPMGFWSLETIKEDAKRHNIKIMGPDINLSLLKSTISGSNIRTGLLHVKNLGLTNSQMIVADRERGGVFKSLKDVFDRTDLTQEILVSLVDSGAFDSFSHSRRHLRWEIGLYNKAINYQTALPLPIDHEIAKMLHENENEIIVNELKSLGFSPTGHMMKEVRKVIPSEVKTSEDLRGMKNGEKLTTAGFVVRRQHPRSAKSFFFTLEDEYGHIPLVIWESVWELYKNLLRDKLLLVFGEISRREGTFNLIVEKVEPVTIDDIDKYENQIVEWR